MEFAILSDTHAADVSEVPGPFRDRVAAADHTIHAGDFDTPEALAGVRELSTELTAVYGNADPDDGTLPAVASVSVEGVTFVVAHGMVNPVRAAVFSSRGFVGSREDWLDAVADTAHARTRGDDSGTLVGVAGHTHEVEDEVYEGVRVLNPGSATGTGVERATMMTATVEDGDVDVTVHDA